MSEEIIARVEALEMDQSKIMEKLAKLERTPVKETPSFLSKFSLPSSPFRKRESDEEAKERKSNAILEKESDIISGADKFNRLRQFQFDKANTAARNEARVRYQRNPMIGNEVVGEASLGGRKRTKRKRSKRKSKRS